MIAVIDIAGNNLTSIGNALEQLERPYQLTHCKRTIQAASHVILPGVGAAAQAMAALERYEMVDMLKQLKQPLLGICLGMQLLLEKSEEGNVTCLGLLPGKAERLSATTEEPVPHMGWNQLIWQDGSLLQAGVPKAAYVYFVHSYALKNSPSVVASCQYSEKFAAIIQRNNVVGMQFHPEKSGEVGRLLLKNFLAMEKIC